MSNRSWVRIFVLLSSLAGACTGANSHPGGPNPGPGPTDLPPAPVTAILVGAGDIADCTSAGAENGAPLAGKPHPGLEAGRCGPVAQVD